jgi:hypothetical protein
MLLFPHLASPLAEPLRRKAPVKNARSPETKNGQALPGRLKDRC